MPSIMGYQSSFKKKLVLISQKNKRLTGHAHTKNKVSDNTPATKKQIKEQNRSSAFDSFVLNFSLLAWLENY